MATLTVYSSSGDGWIDSRAATYTEARSKSASYYPVNTTNFIRVGQRFSAPNYFCQEGFTHFDTSALETAGNITSAALSLWLLYDYSVQDFTQEIRAYDWGGTLEHTDWIAGADLGDNTLLSSLLVDPSAGYNVFVSSAAFISAIVKDGNTLVGINSDRQRIGTTPTGQEYIMWACANAEGTTEDPKLVIDYDVVTANTTNFFFMW